MDLEKERPATKSAAGGNADGFCAVESGTSGAACSPSMSMSVALLHLWRAGNGYAPRGQRVYGLSSGHRRPRTSLIPARIGPDFAEPFLLEGTCEAEVFNA